jgi:hypothetical protein
MANRNMSQFFFGLEKMPVHLEANCVIDSGATDGVRSVKGSGIKAIKKVATGIYKVQLEDSYNRYLGGSAGFVSYIGTPIHIHDASIGSVNVITSLGTTSQAQFELAGVPAGIPAAVGLAFQASASIASVTGTATVAPAKASGVMAVEVVGNANLSVVSVSDPHFFIATMGPTGAGDTTMIPVAPVDGSVLGLFILLRNSSVKSKGE